MTRVPSDITGCLQDVLDSDRGTPYADSLDTGTPAKPFLRDFTGRPTPLPIHVQQPALTFDGVASIANGPSPSFNPTLPFAITFHARSTAFNTTNGIFNFDGRNPLSFIAVSTGQLRLRANSNNISFALFATLNQYHRYGISYDGAGTFTATLDNSSATGGGAAVITSPANMGIGDNGTNNPFTGQIFSWALYDQALTVGQLQGTDPIATTPIQSIPFCEGGGTVAHDVTSNANHATLNGFVTSSAWANRNDAMVRDHSVEYGGRTGAGGEFIPGRLDGSAAADGNPLAFPPGNVSNRSTLFAGSGSRFVFDPYAAPELAALNLPAESPVGELLRTTAPAETKFRSETDDATPVGFSDGDNRVANFSTTLTGQDLSDVVAYINRTPPPTFFAGRVVKSTQTLGAAQ